MSSTAAIPCSGTESTHLAIEALARARATGALLGALPAACRPADLGDALAIQNGRADRAIGGWKCGLPSEGRIILAPIDRTLMFTAPGPVCVTGQAEMRYEPELAFTLARPLEARDGDHDRASVLAAIGETRLALELVHGRFRDPDAVSFLDMLADDLFNEGLVLGPAVTLEHLPQLTVIEIDDGARARSYPAAHPAGDPLAPLVWLANYLATQGRPLQAGVTVITGAFAPAQEVRDSSEVRVTFGALGTVTVAFDFTGART